MGVGEPGDPVGGGREQHPVAALGGFGAVPDRQVGLRGAGRPSWTMLLASVRNPSDASDAICWRTAGLGIPVDLLDRSPGGEPCCADPQWGARRVACCDVAIKDRGEIFLMGPSGVTGMISEPASDFGDRAAFKADAS